MDDYDRALDILRFKECLQGLQILLDSAEVLPDYICSDENYPMDKTIVLSDVKLSSFDFIIGEAMDILEHGIKNHGNIF